MVYEIKSVNGRLIGVLEKRYQAKVKSYTPYKLSSDYEMQYAKYTTLSYRWTMHTNHIYERFYKY